LGQYGKIKKQDKAGTEQTTGTVLKMQKYETQKHKNGTPRNTSGTPETQ
jgi:hypothetical protein